MPDQIDFTPQATATDPTPGAETFTPLAVAPSTAKFGFFQQEFLREAEGIRIPFTDFSFTRYNGTGFKRYEVRGTDTFSTYAAAETQLAKLYKMIGAECSIQSTLSVSTFTAVCIEIRNDLGVETNFYPGFHINYTAIFIEAL